MKRKRVSMAALAALLMLLLAGCGEKEGKEEQIVFDVFSKRSSFDGQGIVWYGSDSGVLQYYDLASGVGTAMCARPDCKHQAPTLADPDSGCDGYYDGIVGCCFLYEGHLYVLYWSPGYGEEDKGYNNYTLCRADPNGTNRRVIAELEELGIPLYYSVDDGLLAIGHHRQYDDKGEELEKYACGVCVVDLESGAVIESPQKEEYGAQVFSVYLEDGIVTYAYQYFTVDLHSFDYEDGSGLNFELMASKVDEILEQRLVQFNLADGQEKEPWPGMQCYVLQQGYVCVTGEDGQTLLARLSDGSTRSYAYTRMDFIDSFIRDGKILMRYYIEEKDASEYLLYDIASGETEKLTCLPDCADRRVIAVADGKAIIQYDDGDGVWMCGWTDEEDLFAGGLDSVDKLHSMGDVSDFY